MLLPVKTVGLETGGVPDPFESPFAAWFPNLAVPVGFLPFRSALSLLELTRMGLLYFTRELCGGIIVDVLLLLLHVVSWYGYICVVLKEDKVTHTVFWKKTVKLFYGC